MIRTVFVLVVLASVALAAQETDEVVMRSARFPSGRYAGVLQGEKEEPKWTLHDAVGEDRFFGRHFAFEPSFENEPNVFVGLSGFETTGESLRVSAKAEDVTKLGANVLYRTWEDGRVTAMSSAFTAVDAAAAAQRGVLVHQGSFDVFPSDSLRKKVLFPADFAVAPRIVLAISKLDTTTQEDVHVELNVVHVDIHGFEFEAKVEGIQGRTLINSVGVNWMAVSDTSENTAQTITAGDVEAGFTETPEFWPLGSGSGVRSFTQHVAFPRDFAQKPVVAAFIRGLDLKGGLNTAKVNVYATDVTPSGFDVVLQTWDAAVVHDLAVAYVAFNPDFPATVAPMRSNTDQKAGEPLPQCHADDDDEPVLPALPELADDDEVTCVAPKCKAPKPANKTLCSGPGKVLINSTCYCANTTALNKTCDCYGLGECHCDNTTFVLGSCVYGRNATVCMEDLRVYVNGSCSAPLTPRNGSKVTPACFNGTHWNATLERCECPDGQYFNATQLACVTWTPNCPGNMTFNGTHCVFNVTRVPRNTTTDAEDDLPEDDPEDEPEVDPEDPDDPEPALPPKPDTNVTEGDHPEDPGYTPTNTTSPPEHPTGYLTPNATAPTDDSPEVERADMDIVVTTTTTTTTTITTHNVTCQDDIDVVMREPGKKCTRADGKLRTGSCYAQTSCMACIAKKECGWCASKNFCVEGDANGAADGPCEMYDFGFCSGEPCSAYTGCGSCVRDPFCGWCDGKCSEGTSAGALNAASCSGSWSYGHCVEEE